MFPVVERQLSEQQKQKLLEAMQQTKRRALISGRTVDLLLQVSPDGVPEQLRADLKCLQQKARVIRDDIIDEVLQAFEQHAVAPEDELVEQQEARAPQELPRIQMPDEDGPEEQSIESLGFKYAWRRENEGVGKVWNLVEATKIEPPALPITSEQGEENDLD